MSEGKVTKYAVPMYESELGWGSKIDGYAGPFGSWEDAKAFQKAFNLKHNSAQVVPDWYIAALEPVVYTAQDCSYKMTI